MPEYEIARPAGRCTVSGRDLIEGEEFYTVLRETATGFERLDVAAEYWTGAPEGAFCFFKTRVPKKTQRRKVFVDDAVLISFFGSLADSAEPVKLRFRFVLSLILLRKRLLKYEQTVRDARGESWRMRLTRDKSEHLVFNPQLDETQIEELSRQLGTVLEGFAEETVEGVEEPGTVPDGQAGAAADDDSGLET